MKSHYVSLLVATILYLALDCRGKMIRNNALMTKMISHFQKDNNLSIDPEPLKDQHERDHPQEAHTLIQDQHPGPQTKKAERVLSMMQNILCSNFPKIPCNMIMQDNTLNNLIERSIFQLTSKQLHLKTVQSTQSPGYGLTLFPTVNSEDLSNFLAVSDTGYFSNKKTGNSERKDPNPSKSRKRNKNVTPETIKNFWSQEKVPKKKSKSNTDAKHPEVYSGRKKMRKFYPHKIKYKDKAIKQDNYAPEYSNEKLSISVEIPDIKMHRKPDHTTFKGDSPVWRIDYMKHGVPSLNTFGFDDERLGKIMKTGPNVIVDETRMDRGVRKEVMHPDVYIKKNLARKNTLNMNSEGAMD